MTDAIDNLIELMKQLRSSEGCPWSKAQTFKSLVPHTVEEAYELAESIYANDMESLKSELGDLLYHVIFYSQIADENNLFTINDVAQTMIDKQYQRNLNLNTEAKSVAERNQTWHKQKRQSVDGFFADINMNLPPMIVAKKIQQRSATIGFDWRNAKEILEKFREEIDELDDELTTLNTEAMADELGDLIFCCVNLARHLEIDPEHALKRTITKYLSRFEAMEDMLKKDNRSLEESHLDELELLWNQAKKETN